MQGRGRSKKEEKKEVVLLSWVIRDYVMQQMANGATPRVVADSLVACGIDYAKVLRVTGKTGGAYVY